MEPDLDPTIHQPTRLRIMLLLYRYRQGSAAWVKSSLQLTDGNLFGHARRLDEAGYIEQGRTLTRDGFQVVLRITSKGSDALRSYLAAWRDLLESDAEPSPSDPKV